MAQIVEFKGVEAPVRCAARVGEPKFLSPITRFRRVSGDGRDEETFGIVDEKWRLVEYIEGLS